VGAANAQPPVTPYKWFDWGHLNLIVFTNHITRQISIQMTMTLRADIRPVINSLVRVLMQSTAVALMSRLCTSGFGVFRRAFLSVEGGLDEVRDVLGGRCNFA